MTKDSSSGLWKYCNDTRWTYSFRWEGTYYRMIFCIWDLGDLLGREKDVWLIILLLAVWFIKIGSTVAPLGNGPLSLIVQFVIQCIALLVPMEWQMEPAYSALLAHTSPMTEAHDASSAHSEFHQLNLEQFENLSVSIYVSFDMSFWQWQLNDVSSFWGLIWQWKLAFLLV